MLWKLFTPRQIVKITVPGEPNTKVDETLLKRFGKEYIVIVGFEPNGTTIKVEIIK